SATADSLLGCSVVAVGENGESTALWSLMLCSDEHRWPSKSYILSPPQAASTFTPLLFKPRTPHSRRAALGMLRNGMSKTIPCSIATAKVLPSPALRSWLLR